jgi:hypothetical protein
VALAVDESGGDVEQPVAQCLGLGLGQVAAEKQQLSPGDQVGREHHDAEPGRVDPIRLTPISVTDTARPLSRRSGWRLVVPAGCR